MTKHGICEHCGGHCKRGKKECKPCRRKFRAIKCGERDK